MELSSNTNSTPFRIGGVYRNHNGQVAVLRELNVGGEFNVGSFPADGPRWEGDNGYASHRLSDGWTSLAETPEHRYNLLPGELHQVNGEWVPVEAPAKSLGAILREKLQQPAPAAAPEPNRPRLTWADPKPVDRFLGFISEYSVSGAEMYSGTMDHAHSSPLQRLGDTASPLHGSAFLREE